MRILVWWSVGCYSDCVGGIGGRLISGWLSEFCGWRIGVAVVGLIGVVAALVCWRALPPSRHFVAQPLRWRTVAGRFTGMFHDRGLPWLFIEGFLLLGAFVTVYNYLGYRLLAPPYNQNGRASCRARVCQYV